MSFVICSTVTDRDLAQNHETALMLAARNGHGTIVSQLIQANVSLDITNEVFRSVFSALQCGCKATFDDFLRLLIVLL